MINNFTKIKIKGGIIEKAGDFELFIIGNKGFTQGQKYDAG